MLKGQCFLIMSMFFYSSSYSQEITEDLPPFDKIKTISHINLVLIKGDDESIRIVYEDVETDEINFIVKGTSLEIFLDGAKISDRNITVETNGTEHKESYYKDANITAYITFRELKRLEFRGEENAVCEDVIKTKKLKVKLYGETKVAFARVEADKIKGKLYGENILEIKDGAAATQKYSLYGENIVETARFRGSEIAAKTYGHNSLNINAEKHINLFGFGELNLMYSGNSSFSKFLIGDLIVEKVM